MTEHIAEQWRRPGPTPAQRRNDLWIGVGMVGGAILFVILVNSIGPIEKAPSMAEQMLWAVAMTLPLCVRRRWPEIVMVLVAAAMVGAQARAAAGDNQFASIACFFALYTLGAWGRDRVRARWLRVIVILGMFVWLAISLMTGLSVDPSFFEDSRGPLDPLLALALWNVGINLMYFLSAYYFGNVGWESARRQHELTRQAEELRRSQEENARRAVVDERVRIARDLHDVVAHNVSVMGIQASAARRVLDSDRTMAERCLRTVEDTARTAVSELRGLLGVLRSGDAEPTDRDQDTNGSAGRSETLAGGRGAGETEYAASPGLDQIENLVEELRTAGYAVDSNTYGESRPVPNSIALSIYRVAQEALTNITKHAGSCNVDVRLRYLDSAVEVEVGDDGRGVDAASRRATGRGGYGLVGMRERVTVHGGVLEAGPRRTGGFQVRARFPLEPAVGGRTNDRELA